MFCGSGGSTVGSLKRRVRRWEKKNCTLWWREPHSEVKTCKAPQFWSTFASEALCMIWPHFFVAGASKTRWYEAISSALNWPFSKKSLRIASFFMLSTFRKLRKSRRNSSVWGCRLPFCEELSQTCFVVDLPASTFEGSLAELQMDG